MQPHADRAIEQRRHVAHLRVIRLASVLECSLRGAALMRTGHQDLDSARSEVRQRDLADVTVEARIDRGFER
jgi:hypothetical protein